MIEKHRFLNLTMDYDYFFSPGKSEGGSPGRDTTTLTMSPFGGVGALNVPSALFSDSASRIPKSDPMEGRLQVPDLNF